MTKNRSGKELKCPQCGTVFYCVPSRIKSSGKNCCSLRCSGLWSSYKNSNKKDKWPNLTYFIVCKECGELDLRRKPCRINREKWKFCSQSCRRTYKNKTDNPSWRPKVRELQSKQLKNLWKERRSHFIKVFNNKDRIQKVREANLGKNHWNWQGGKTKLARRVRNCKKYEKWRERVFKRDNYTCQKCGTRGGVELNADHIEPFSKLIDGLKNYEEAMNNEKLWSVDNGRTLCLSCHKKTKTFANSPQTL